MTRTRGGKGMRKRPIRESKKLLPCSPLLFVRGASQSGLHVATGSSASSSTLTPEQISSSPPLCRSPRRRLNAHGVRPPRLCRGGLVSAPRSRSELGASSRPSGNRAPYTWPVASRRTSSRPRRQPAQALPDAYLQHINNPSCTLTRRPSF